MPASVSPACLIDGTYKSPWTHLMRSDNNRGPSSVEELELEVEDESKPGGGERGLRRASRDGRPPVGELADEVGSG